MLDTYSEASVQLRASSAGLSGGRVSRFLGR